MVASRAAAGGSCQTETWCWRRRGIDPQRGLASGLVAGQIRLGTQPASLQVIFDNPIAQKTVRIRSTASYKFTAVADAVVKVNRSGSVAVNSLVVQ